MKDSRFCFPLHHRYMPSAKYHENFASKLWILGIQKSYNSKKIKNQKKMKHWWKWTQYKSKSCLLILYINMLIIIKWKDKLKNYDFRYLTDSIVFWDVDISFVWNIEGMVLIAFWKINLYDLTYFTLIGQFLWCLV